MKEAACILEGMRFQKFPVEHGLSDPLDSS